MSDTFSAKPANITATIAVTPLRDMLAILTGDDLRVSDMRWQDNALMVKLSNGQVFIGEFREINPADAHAVMASHANRGARYLQGFTEADNG